MADKDTVTKEYMQNREIFADAFNFYLYKGRQVIQPDRLRPLDTTSVVLPYGEGGKPVPVQRYRDVLKMVTAMEDDRAAYMLLGIENQSEMHYAMPVRNMLYDAMQYVEQVEETAKSHKMGDKMPETRAEFLSGFYKTDKLLPVITLTVYFGADEWNAPKDLHSMLAADDEILPFVDNYHLHLIAPAEIADSDFVKFHTELSLAFKFIRESKSKQGLMELIYNDASFRSVSKKTVDLVNAVTKSNIRYDSREEHIDMCKAIEGIINDARAEGMEQGITRGMEKGMEKGMAKGLEQGMEKGMAKGMEKGLEQGILHTLIGLVKDGILTLADAAKRAGMTVPEFEEKARLLEQA